MAEAAPLLPNTPLDPATQEELRDALLHAFPAQPAIASLLRYKWGFDLSDEMDPGRGKKYVYADVVTFADGEGRGRDLLALALSAKPGNPKLQSLSARLLPNVASATAKYAAPAGTDVAAPASLEALVARESHLFEWGAYVARMGAIGPRLCRITVGDAKGTGFLVGPSLVLTNYHVVESVVAEESRWPEVVCLFDFWRKPGDLAEPPGTPVTLAATGGIVTSKPYSQSDVTGTGDPAEAELDYALLRLSQPMGDQRGFFPLSPRPTIVAEQEPVLIPQHAAGDPLRGAYGRIVALPASGLRYRYNVTTDHGSSGAPLFTAELDPIGLHHAADPAYAPAYNQAIPLWRIARSLADAAIDLAD